MNVLIHWVVSALAILVSSYVLPGIKVEGFVAALTIAVVMGLVNAVIKPILIVLTLPINILTLGLFTIVINAFLILLVAKIVPGFTVAGFGWAIAFSIVLSLVGAVLQSWVK